MAVADDERVPHTIRKDAALKKEYPPASLVELAATPGPGGSFLLYWQSPETIASAKALKAFHEKLHSGASWDEARAAGRRAFREALPQ
jgi:hypothetical protein